MVVVPSRQEAGTWLDGLTYTEKVKLHLSRALIMNPEVIVLQRPLHHYDSWSCSICSRVVGLRNDGLLSSFHPYVSGLAKAKVFHTTVTKLVRG